MEICQCKSTKGSVGYLIIFAETLEMCKVPVQG
jgi:hypothetical protein